MHGPKGGRIPPNFPSPLLLLSLQPPIIKNDVNKMLNMKTNSKNIVLKIKNLGNKILKSTFNEINFFINQ